MTHVTPNLRKLPSPGPQKLEMAKAPWLSLLSKETGNCQPNADSSDFPLKSEFGEAGEVPREYILADAVGDTPWTYFNTLVQIEDALTGWPLRCRVSLMNQAYKRIRLLGIEGKPHCTVKSGAGFQRRGLGKASRPMCWNCPVITKQSAKESRLHALPKTPPFSFKPL